MLDFHIHDYPVVGSTNDTAKELLRQGALEGTVVWAKRQTAGRGRRGRPWISEPGNLYCSLILRPKCSLMQASQLSFVIAVAVGQTMLQHLSTPDILSYKWPNDILLNHEKVSGILIETESTKSDQVEACIIGIGINLNSVPDHPSYSVTALNLHTVNKVILDNLLATLLENIKLYYQDWMLNGFSSIREKWLQRAYKLGQPITISIAKEKLSGRFIGLSQEGALMFEKLNGTISQIMSAEVS